MKTSCRILSVVLMVLLLVSLSANAFAADAQYQVTKDFINLLKDVKGATCEVADIVSDSTGNYELVYVTYDGELSDYVSNIAMLFAEDASEVQLYMYNLITFSEEKLPDVLKAVNDLNHRATGAKLFVDMSDYSVTAEMYQLLPDSDGASLATVALGFMISMTDTLYEQLQTYAQ